MRRLLPLIVIVMGVLMTPALAQSGAQAGAPLPQTPAPRQTPPPQPPPQAPTPTAGQRGGRGQGTPAAMGGFAPRDTWVASPAVNVKLELSITDTYAGTPAKKTVTLLVANGGNGMIRTSNRLPDGSPVNLNVDCEVHVVPMSAQARDLPNRDRGPEVIRTSLTFLYTPAQSSQGEGKPAPRPADLTESVNVLLADGKLTVVSQSADPATDRKVTVEVTASIVK